MAVQKRNNVLTHFVGVFQRDTIEAAMAIAAYLHQGKFDKGGVPYLMHPWWVADAMRKDNFSMDHIIVALLHDTIEDTPVTENELLEWFNIRIVTAIKALSKNDGEDIDAYIRRVMVDPIAREVKKKDLRHNSDISRLKNRHNLNEKDFTRLKSYAWQYDYLVGGAVGV